MILKNDYMDARFNEQSGSLIHVSLPGGVNLLRASGCHCVEDGVVVDETTEDAVPQPFQRGG